MTSPRPVPAALPDLLPVHGRRWPGALVWLAGWLLLFALDGRIDLANQALVLVLLAALASPWLHPGWSVAACAASVVAFNYAFVPPRGTFAVHLDQHVLLLLTMLAVASLVSLLMARQRSLAERAALQARRTRQLRDWGELLREAGDAEEAAGLPEQLLARLRAASGSAAALLLQEGAATAAAAEAVHGASGSTALAAMRACARDGRAMGPQTGRHEELNDWYLPLRGAQACHGAAAIVLSDPDHAEAELREHLQALCDQFGLALSRRAAQAAAAAAREAAHAHSLRSTLLAAISHDHRTPLATILGAATSLHDQDERLAPAQRRQLAAIIADEAGQLTRLTENTLQLARLDTPGVSLRLDWEAIEELAGNVIGRLRRRGAAVSAQIEAGLPLLRCDAVLLVQLMDNLLDNALKYGGAAEIIARRAGDDLLLQVCDRGPGIAPELREAIFEPFRRGESPAALPDGTRGAGLGLAVCRAIARAHGGELRYAERAGGGSCFELALPLPPQPQPAAEGESA